MTKLWTRLQLAAGRCNWQALLDGPALVALAAALSLAVAAAVAIATARSASADGPPVGVKLADKASVPAPWPGAWNGPWIGMHLGGAAVATDVEGASLAGDGILGGLDAGYDARFGNIVAGAWGRYTWAHLETSLGGESVTLEGAWTFGLRGGVLITPKLLAYGTYGWTQAKASATFDVGTLDGRVLGGGLEALISDSLSLKLEYLATDFGRQAVDEDTFRTDQHAVMLGLAWRLGK
jgi:outer membrane immunogenic protein